MLNNIYLIRNIAQLSCCNKLLWTHCYQPHNTAQYIIQLVVHTFHKNCTAAVVNIYVNTLMNLTEYMIENKNKYVALYIFMACK